jgi:hypothetical protein
VAGVSEGIEELCEQYFGPVTMLGKDRSQPSARIAGLDCWGDASLPNRLILSRSSATGN